MRKKQDNDVSKEHAVPVPNIDVTAEKVPTPISLSAPAVNTGGRDAMPLRTSLVPSSSSALDLIKKKLQESGVPSSSPVPVTPVTAAVEINGSRAVDAKGLQSESSKEKLKDATGDGNISDSSSDSEDTDSGPSKEECIMKFKVIFQILVIFGFITAIRFYCWSQFVYYASEIYRKCSKNEE